MPYELQEYWVENSQGRILKLPKTDRTGIRMLPISEEAALTDPA